MATTQNFIRWKNIITITIIELLFITLSYFLALCFLFSATFGNDNFKGLFISRIIGIITILANIIVCYLLGNKLLKNISPHPIIFEWAMVFIIMNSMIIIGEMIINSHPKLTTTNLYVILYNIPYIVFGIMGSYFAKTNTTTHI